MIFPQLPLIRDGFTSSVPLASVSFSSCSIFCLTFLLASTGKLLSDAERQWNYVEDENDIRSMSNLHTVPGHNTWKKWKLRAPFFLPLSHFGAIINLCRLRHNGPTLCLSLHLSLLLTHTPPSDSIVLTVCRYVDNLYNHAHCSCLLWCTLYSFMFRESTHPQINKLHGIHDVSSFEPPRRPRHKAR